VNKITLMRMKTEVIADRRKLFELFTSIKNRAILDHDPNLSSIADQTIDLWTRMVFTFLFPQNYSHLSSSFCKCYSAARSHCICRAFCVHFQFLADNEHDKKIESNVQELQAAIKMVAEQIIGQLPCLRVEYQENKAIKSLRDELKVQREELTQFQSKCTFQVGVIKELEAKLDDAKDKAKDSAAKDNDMAELMKKLAVLQTELGNTKAALDKDESELKKDREMLIKDQQMLAEKEHAIEDLNKRLKAAEEKNLQTLKVYIGTLALEAWGLLLGSAP
jgi:hypothetical protein